MRGGLQVKMFTWRVVKERQEGHGRPPLSAEETLILLGVAWLRSKGKTIDIIDRKSNPL